MTKQEILKELIKNVHVPSYCDEGGFCEALEDCEPIEANECSCCGVNNIVKAFCKGIEYQKSWISVEDKLPCDFPDIIKDDFSTNKVLVMTSDNNIFLSFMLKLNNIWKWGRNDIDNITHWKSI